MHSFLREGRSERDAEEEPDGLVSFSVLTAGPMEGEHVESRMKMLLRLPTYQSTFLKQGHEVPFKTTGPEHLLSEYNSVLQILPHISS